MRRMAFELDEFLQDDINRSMKTQKYHKIHILLNMCCSVLADKVFCST